MADHVYVKLFSFAATFLVFAGGVMSFFPGSKHVWCLFV